MTRRAVIAAMLVLVACGNHDDVKSKSSRDVAKEQLKLCERIHDEALRVKCIDGVAHP